MNTFVDAMRDGSVEYGTAYSNDGHVLFRTPDLSTGVAGLGGLGEVVARFPATGQRQIVEAFVDPETKEEAVGILTSSDPFEAAARQAEKDIAEAAHPTGRKIVFKEIARKFGPRIRAAEEAVMAAMPDRNTEEAEVAREILASSPTPERDLERFYTEVALEAVGLPPELFDETAGWTEESEGLYGLGMSKKWKRRLKGVVKVLKVGAIVAGTILAAPLVVKAVGAVGGAIVGGVKSLFGAGKPAEGVTTGPMPEGAEPPPPPPPPPSEPTMWEAFKETMVPKPEAPGIPWEKITEVGIDLYLAKRRSDQLRAAQRTAEAAQQEQQAAAAREQAVQSLVQQGIPREQAVRYVRQAEEQAAAQMPEPPPPPPGEEPPTPPVAKAEIPILPIIAIGAVVLMSLGGKARKNPRHARMKSHRCRSCGDRFSYLGRKPWKCPTCYVSVRKRRTA